MKYILAAVEKFLGGKCCEGEQEERDNLILGKEQILVKVKRENLW